MSLRTTKQSLPARDARNAGINNTAVLTSTSGIFLIFTKLEELIHYCIKKSRLDFASLVLAIVHLLITSETCTLPRAPV